MSAPCRCLPASHGRFPQNLHPRHEIVPETSPPGAIQWVMSYNLTLPCGCLVYVACHPQTGVAHTRVLDHRQPGCRVRTHEVGVRLSVWQLAGEALISPVEKTPQAVPRREIP
jgi:hypothetical protein